MDTQDLNTFLDSIKEKLGEENSALIADDLGTLITKNTEAVNNITNRDKEIQRLNNLNEKLVSANGSLLQQVSFGTEKNFNKQEDDVPVKSFNFRDAFDEKGRFKQKM